MTQKDSVRAAAAPDPEQKLSLWDKIGRGLSLGACVLFVLLLVWALAIGSGERIARWKNIQGVESDGPIKKITLTDSSYISQYEIFMLTDSIVQAVDIYRSRRWSNIDTVGEGDTTTTLIPRLTIIMGDSLGAGMQARIIVDYPESFLDDLGNGWNAQLSKIVVNSVSTGKVDSASYADSSGVSGLSDSTKAVTWADISSKPSTFDPTSHEHSASSAEGDSLDPRILVIYEYSDTYPTAPNGTIIVYEDTGAGQWYLKIKINGSWQTVGGPW